MKTKSMRVRPVAITMALILTIVSVGEPHDFWLVPNAFRISAGGELVIRGQTSSKFPSSESAVTPDRITDARILGATGAMKVENVTVAGASLVLRNRPSGAGQRIVALSIAPRSLRASGRDFKRYMELEGASTLAARYEREGILPKTDSITRRYAKYAKTIVEVGKGGPRAFTRVVGQPAEFVPLDDPGTARSGDTLRVRLIFRGEPLRHAHVDAGFAVDGNTPVDSSVETDVNGVARIPLGRHGLWNIRALHILPAESGSGADWESHFVTLVFEVGSPRPSRAGVIVSPPARR